MNLDLERRLTIPMETKAMYPVTADLVPIAGYVGKVDGILDSRFEDIVQEGQFLTAVIIAAHIAGRGIRLDRIKLSLHLFHALDLGIDAGQFDLDGLGLGIGLFNALPDRFIDKLIIRQPDQDKGQNDENDFLAAGEITTQNFHGLATSGALR